MNSSLDILNVSYLQSHLSGQQAGNADLELREVWARGVHLRVIGEK